MSQSHLLRLEEPVWAFRVDDYTGKPYGDQFLLSAGAGGWFVRRVRSADVTDGVEWFRMEVSRSGDKYDHWQTVEIEGEPITKSVPLSTRP
jgi:hypothetical protein